MEVAVCEVVLAATVAVSIAEREVMDVEEVKESVEYGSSDDVSMSTYSSL